MSDRTGGNLSVETTETTKGTQDRGTRLDASAQADTARSLLDAGANTDAAVVTPDGTALTFAQLRSEVDRLATDLRQMGLGHRDRIAIVTGNGPEMALVFLAASVAGCAAPLNPKYRAAELQFYMDDLGAQAMIARADRTGTAAREAAAALGIPTVTLAGSVSEGPGSVELQAQPINAAQPAADNDFTPRADDFALVLHTSGTTSRPKIVPLRQRNLALSARAIAHSLALTAADRSLNVMPLFHIHGLLAGLLAPLSVGGSVVCTNGFDAFAFFKQLQEFRPSYYTAVPTMHQMVIARSARNRDVARQARLRFVRSSSASLPAPVFQSLTQLFEAPVIEAYGMTEATHQMCSNPLPPRVAKVRSVGVAAGIEVAVLDPDGAQLDAGERGEVSIKGPTVIDGYESNPQANKEAFTAAGWFRTGDEGYLDAEGYLFLTGRLKEQINRGGEKISPLEVDEALLRHPDVAQAVTFALPHPKLGEDVAAAVVAAGGATIDQRDLRRFVSQSLAAFKVPRRVLVLDELPKGATGKLQRIGLAKRLGLSA